MSWEFLTSSLAGVTRSELPGAFGKRANLTICGMSAGAFTVRADHPEADALLTGDGLLRVYEVNDNFLVDGDRRLHHHGRIVTADEVATADDVTVAVTTADPFWTLMRRLVGKSQAGYSRGSALGMVDVGVIALELLAAANAEGPSGVTAGDVATSSSSYVSGWWYKKLGEALVELFSTLDGPDWRIRPIEFVAGGGLGYYGALDIAPVIGQQRPDAAFEYGGDDSGLANVTGYKRAVTRDGSGNRFFHLPPGFPDNADAVPIMVEDVAAQAATGLLEEVVNADLSVDDLRLKLLQHHLRVRVGARQVITFDPVRDAGGDRVPRLGADFNVGDVVPLRASIVRYQADTEGAVVYTAGDPTDPDARSTVKRLDVLTRVYSADVTVDELGAGTLSLTTVPT